MRTLFSSLETDRTAHGGEKNKLLQLQSTFRSRPHVTGAPREQAGHQARRGLRRRGEGAAARLGVEAPARAHEARRRPCNPRWNGRSRSAVEGGDNGTISYY